MTKREKEKRKTKPLESPQVISNISNRNRSNNNSHIAATFGRSSSNRNRSNNNPHIALLTFARCDLSSRSSQSSSRRKRLCLIHTRSSRRICTFKKSSLSTATHSSSRRFGDTWLRLCARLALGWASCWCWETVDGVDTYDGRRLVDDVSRSAGDSLSGLCRANC